MKNTACIFDISRSSFVDGPGIRTTVFFKGCNLRCKWCHNPESMSPKPELMFYEEKCKGCGACARNCPNELKTCSLCGKCAHYCLSDARKLCGESYTVDELFTEIASDRAFYETSGGGVTFSGGECMLQVNFLTKILKKCKDEAIDTAVDTAGNVPWESFEKVLPHTDLFLYDIKLMNSALHREFTGADNKIILENLSRLLKVGARIWVRIPVIAGVNDNAGEMSKVNDFFKNCGYPEKIELLPYHKLGESKLRALGKESLPFSPPTDEKLEELKAIFADS